MAGVLGGFNWASQHLRSEVERRVLDRGSAGCVSARRQLRQYFENEMFPRFAAGFDVSTAMAWRYVDETVEGLAAWAPGFHKALVGPGEGGFVIVDPTLVPNDRSYADEPYYSM